MILALAALCPGGLWAAQPVMLEKAAGSWNGRVYGAPGRFDVSVSITRDGAGLKAVFRAIGMGDNKSKLDGEFFPSAGDGACFNVKVLTLTAPRLEVKALACPAGSETLTLTSTAGNGKLAFSDNFGRCTFSFSGPAGRANGILYRAVREKTVPGTAAPKTGKKNFLQAPAMRRP